MGSAAESYNPEARFDVDVHEIDYCTHEDGTLPALIYQPQGDGPFPTVIDIHGGAWNRGTYLDNQRIDRELAASGLVVMAAEFRQAPQYPYPTQVADAHYATRWFKAHASEYKGDAQTLGGLGTSSGGHTMMLSAMKPHDPRYAAIPLPEGPALDATLLYVLAAWPVLDSYARYCFAKDEGRAPLMEATEAYFLTEAAMQEGNPQYLLERGESVVMPPTLILQGTNDNNVPLTVCQRFTEAYQAAGGAVELELFPDMAHGFAREPGAESDRALALMKAFVKQQLAIAPSAV